MRNRRVLVPLLALPIAATAVTGAPAQALAHGRRITVTSAAYFTERGPHVLSATIAR
ncbi:hypothetical protein P8A18_21000 [Streptomyces castrisilvae]|uniref:Uncharacterized protein n=1 Tax=Streptomyces castrisilvae TaxID=3033811 RepID=A0ABY9HMI3_9ACTN|nr:hypothetical protein [Streptomyces sp. Mut1]WLQ35745.1 hypothetical protein P8A18_21000 [Streptomyces sp. Mut1]